MKIARRFNAGDGWKNVESRRDGWKWYFGSAVPAGLFATPPEPGVKTPGYFQDVPAGHGIFGGLRRGSLAHRDW